MIPEPQFPWLRGCVLVGEARDAVGKETKGRHYWLLVSWNAINANPRLPVMVIPIVTHRPSTFFFESDVVVPKKDSPTDEDILIRCGQVRVLDRSDVKPTENTTICLDEVMIAVETKLIVVLGMRKRWTRKVK